MKTVIKFLVFALCLLQLSSATAQFVAHADLGVAVNSRFNLPNLARSDFANIWAIYPSWTIGGTYFFKPKNAQIKKSGLGFQVLYAKFKDFPKFVFYGPQIDFRPYYVDGQMSTQQFAAVFYFKQELTIRTNTFSWQLGLNYSHFRMQRDNIYHPLWIGSTVGLHSGIGYKFTQTQILDELGLTYDLFLGDIDINPFEIYPELEVLALRLKININEIFTAKK